MTAELLFPTRRKCKTCRRALGSRTDDPVLFGLYCSARCAGLAEPARTPAEAPRECVTMRGGRWQWKRRYRSESEIPDKLREDPSTNFYTCAAGHIHIGHTRMGTSEQFRMFTGTDDVRDLLVKLRGRASHQQVADVAGVRPIRIKELEAGIKHLDSLDTLFKVMHAYRTRLGAALPVGKVAEQVGQR